MPVIHLGVDIYSPIYSFLKYYCIMYLCILTFVLWFYYMYTIVFDDVHVLVGD